MANSADLETDFGATKSIDTERRAGLGSLSVHVAQRREDVVMNIEEIVSQPAINATPCLWPPAVDADMQESEATVEPWIVDRAQRESTERPWPRIFPGL
jgi:hypothetical protein